LLLAFVPVRVARDGLLNGARGLSLYSDGFWCRRLLLLLAARNFSRGSVLLSKLSKEVECITSRHLREIRLESGWFSRLLRSVYLWFGYLAAKNLLVFKVCSLFVDSKLLEQLFVVVSEKTLEHLEFHDIVVILTLLTLLIGYLGNIRTTFKLLDEFCDSLGEIWVALLLVDLDAVVVEGHQFVAKAKSSSDPSLNLPLRNVDLASLSRGNGSGVLPSRVRKQTLRLKGKNRSSALLSFTHTQHFAMELVGPSDVLVGLISGELQHGLI